MKQNIYTGLNSIYSKNKKPKKYLECSGRCAKNNRKNSNRGIKVQKSIYNTFEHANNKKKIKSNIDKDYMIRLKF